MEKPRDLFRDLCENATDLIQSVSPGGRFLYVNRSWLRTLGYREEEVPRLSLPDVFHPDHEDRWDRVVQHLAGGRSVPFFEGALRTRDNRQLPVEGNASCRLEKGRLLSTGWILRDISKRKGAQEELDRLFNLSLDLLCIAGTDGYFKRINPAFGRVLGYSREELLSRSFIEFVHPDDRESTLREVENLARGRPVVDFQNRYQARDGTYRWLAWRSAPLPSQGLIYAVARDITESKRDQEVMARQTAELARSNADLEQFAYVASHDLRAPLRSIENLAEWIDERLPPDLPGEVRRHLEQLRTRVRRMETLTDDLLQYSRAGRRVSNIEPVDTGAVIRELTFLLAPPEGFSVTAAPGMPVLETAKAPLEQVLRNLIGNAIKHHDRSNGRVEISAREEEEFFEFAVADDGPGIPAEAHQKVFQMFQKLSSRSKVEGNGIGLALVKRIVESQGGRVTVESQQRHGATFRFTWPRRMETLAPSQHSRRGTSKGGDRADHSGG